MQAREPQAGFGPRSAVRARAPQPGGQDPFIILGLLVGWVAVLPGVVAGPTVRAPTRFRWGLAGVLIGIQLMVASGVGSEERFRAGTMDLTLAGGYSVSHKVGQAETVPAYHLMPHFGYILTDEHGPGWLRGNFELLAEPTLIHLENRDPATVAGLAALGRWVFAGWSGVRPYVEAGAGVVGGQVNLPQMNCDVNFVVEAGPGLLLFVSRTAAVTVGYRFHHVSNADLCSRNRSLNSSLFTVGLSYFFR